MKWSNNFLNKVKWVNILVKFSYLNINYSEVDKHFEMLILEMWTIKKEQRE